MQECAKKRFGNDTRLINRFVEVGIRIVKTDQIKMSLDYLQSNDYEMASNVFGANDLVKEVIIFSDKCGNKEL